MGEKLMQFRNWCKPNPDFLWRLVEPRNYMRLSVKKVAHNCSRSVLRRRKPGERQALSWSRRRRDHSSRSLSDHRNCETALSRLRFRWLAMALVAASLGQAPLFAMQEPPPPQTGAPQGAPEGDDPHIAEEQAAERQALGFLGYLDHGRFADSYAYTGMLIRAQMDREAFASQIEKTRLGVGALQARELIDAGYATSVPGAPEGQYVVLHYHSSFANRPDAVETLTLAFAKGYWRVSGYYIK
jgi:Protein of unknown function (DUF4019)